jgi:hypothetical protein
MTMPSIWTVITAVAGLVFLAAFQWWLAGHARRFPGTHQRISRSPSRTALPRNASALRSRGRALGREAEVAPGTKRIQRRRRLDLVR